MGVGVKGLVKGNGFWALNGLCLGVYARRVVLFLDSIQCLLYAFVIHLNTWPFKTEARHCHSWFWDSSFHMWVCRSSLVPLGYSAYSRDQYTHFARLHIMLDTVGGSGINP
jgi:hypothetical protein